MENKNPPPEEQSYIMKMATRHGSIKSKFEEIQKATKKLEELLSVGIFDAIEMSKVLNSICKHKDCYDYAIVPTVFGYYCEKHAKEIQDTESSINKTLEDDESQEDEVRRELDERDYESHVEQSSIMRP